MLKNIAKLEFKIGERLYQFLCDNDSPLPELKEVFFQFQKYIGQIEDEVNRQIKEKEEQEKDKPFEKISEIEEK
jgi:hypothetical protein